MTPTVGMYSRGPPLLARKCVLDDFMLVILIVDAGSLSDQVDSFLNVGTYRICCFESWTHEIAVMSPTKWLALKTWPVAALRWN